MCVCVCVCAWRPTWHRQDISVQSSCSEVVYCVTRSLQVHTACWDQQSQSLLQVVFWSTYAVLLCHNLLCELQLRHVNVNADSCRSLWAALHCSADMWILIVTDHCELPDLNHNHVVGGQHTSAAVCDLDWIHNHKFWHP